MHPDILALGYSEAAMLLRQANAPCINALISIHGNREYPVETQNIPTLHLSFDDVESCDLTDPVFPYRSYLRLKWAKENGLNLSPPTKNDANSIIAFARETKSLEGTVLCHCSAGISRAPAAALLCLAVWKGAGSERECVSELMRIRPSATPHRDLIRFGEALLNLEGRLTDALIQAKRG